jgi:hypothetical protein
MSLSQIDPESAHCPLCRVGDGVTVSGGTVWAVRCARCGEFEVAQEFVRRNREKGPFHDLSGLARECFERGERLRLTTENAAEYEGLAPKTVTEKVARLLHAIARKSRHPGQKVDLYGANDYPLAYASNKNEAIWVMTSDQVEFSTGWTIIARIQSRDDAIKFLSNYPNGALTTVLDTEVRGKLQAVFGLEVTDLPMEELRKNATPHVQKSEKEVIDFFAKRGITITNLGIQGGFVYKDQSIQKKMVEVFNAEQERSIRKAESDAQRERNNQIQLAADAEAKALLTKKKAEADGVKLVADAKAYEMKQAAERSDLYLGLKILEISRSRVEKWDGRFPYYFMSPAGSPEMLLNLPAEPPPANKP